MVVLQIGGVTVCWCGSVAEWWCGSVAVSWCGSLSVGWCGSVVVLLFSSVLEWWCGSVVVVEVWKCSRCGNEAGSVVAGYNQKVQHSTLFLQGATVWYYEIQLNI